MTQTDNNKTLHLLVGGQKRVIPQAIVEKLMALGTVFRDDNGQYHLEDGEGIGQLESVIEHGIQYPKVIVLCTNSEGAPEFHTCSPPCSQAEIDAGHHYEMAKQNAEVNGYTGPMLAFDEKDPAAKQMGEVLAWL